MDLPHRRIAMKMRLARPFAIPLVFAVLAAVLLSPGEAAAQRPGGAAPRTFVVRTGKPERRTIAQSIRKTGGLTSPAVVDVSAKISARLATLELDDGTRVEEGTRVRKGQRLATLESSDYAAQVTAATAALRSAEVTMADRKRELDRAETLFREGTATEQERDFARADFERAGAAVEQAKAQVELATINLAETVLTAPMDGVVSARHVEPGTLLSPGSKIVTITQIDTLRFQLNVPTTLFAQLALGQTTLEIEVDAYPGEVVSGTLSRIYPQADSDTRTVRVEAVIDNAAGRYLPGMYAVAELALNRRENVLVVPNEAVVRNVDHNIVYRVDKGVARAIQVGLGIRSDEVVEIVSGIAETDEIVVVGQHRLSDGVNVVPETAH
jgi:membrane fusion protein (multidrug efflux system)